MQIHVGERREGDVLTLRVLEGVSEAVLMEMLKAEGIEIVVGPVVDGTARLELRAPKRMMVLVEKAQTGPPQVDSG
ncbi:hypothetical protein [Metapseudomonas resinovorans]|uniref:Uncharacterized protein n=1 Tax=Metapseudomonas resinovorans NBRC 106553 TaxID=1245471 RepID=S6AIT7_METRE|nr:hypothetical protein [Pseudomonas resinovorans]BAN50577.1 hypothetical protein PCA10_48450 [Pseudomonas resinovorans NBRC 106553]